MSVQKRLSPKAGKTNEEPSIAPTRSEARAKPYRKLLLWGALLVILPAAVGAAVSWAVTSRATPHQQIVYGDGTRGPLDMAWVPAGQFEMGSDSKQAQTNERPAHKVRVHGFWMDRHHVTNAEFARFVAATGYVTTAEKKPDWESLRVQLPPGTPKPDGLVPGAMVFVGTTQAVPLDDWSRWWRFMPGADWRHPDGPSSNIVGKADYPVVQVSLADAQAYA